MQHQSNGSSSQGGTPSERSLSADETLPGNENLRVLVVDDNPVGRRIMTMLLERQKVTYKQAGSGYEAIGLFRTFKPTLVWKDIQSKLTFASICCNTNLWDSARNGRHCYCN